MNKIIKNETLSFLLPMLSSHIYSKNFLLNKYFIGAFIGDANRYEYDNEILLVYKLGLTMDFLNFDAQLCKNPNYTGISYDYPDKGLVVYVFKVPLELEEEYYKVMNGTYSLLDPGYKLHIVKFWEVKNEDNSKVFNILFKQTKMQEYWLKKGVNVIEVCMPNEVWLTPVLESEIFSIDNI
jgi:hypothetical protein